MYNSYHEAYTQTKLRLNDAVEAHLVRKTLVNKLVTMSYNLFSYEVQSMIKFLNKIIFTLRIVCMIKYKK